jgi:zinc protease
MAFRSVFILAFLSVSALTVAQPKPAKTSPGLAAPIPFDPAVRVGKLANGLTFYIRKNAEPRNRAELRLVVRTGSVLETDGQRGLAHFMEHMAFNGTKNFPKNELVNFLQSSGVRFGADLNAYTSFDETVYQLPVPTDSANVFERSMQILEDWAHNATLDSAEIEKERGVVLEERRLGRGAQQRLQDKTLPVILNNSRYANRLPIGQESVLKTFRRATLLNFYRQWYRPDLMAVVAVGDFDVQKVEAMIRQKFSRIPAATRPVPRPVYAMAPQPGTRVVIATDAEQPYTVVQVIGKRPEIRDRTLADLRDGLTRALFNQLLSARMGELTQQADPPFLFGNSSYGSYLANLDAFTSVAVAKEGNVSRALTAVLAETARVGQFGFTTTEFDRVKQEFLTAIEQSYLERDKRQSGVFVDAYIQHFLKQSPATGFDFYHDFVVKQLPGISLAEVNKLAGQFTTPDNRVIVVTAPEKDKDKLPAEPALLALVNGAGQGLTAYVDQTGTGPLLATLPTGSPVVKTDKRPDLGVTEWTLQNGVRVILKPTDFKNDQIIFTGSSAGGTSLYDLPDYESAGFAGTLVNQSGVGGFNQIQLGKLLAGKTVGVSAEVDELSESISGSAAPKDLETAMQLTYSYFTQPRRDSAVAVGLLSRVRSFFVNRQLTPTPTQVFQDTAAAVLGNYNPRRLPPSPAAIDRVNIDRAMTIYRDRFADAGDFTFVFVGNFTETGIRPLVERYLGGLPSSGRKESFRDLGIRIPSGQISRTVRLGSDPKASVQLVYSGDFTWSAANQVQLDALAEVLEIKLTEKLREEESSVYGVGVGGSYSKFPVPRYTLQISFGCAPENVEKLIARTNAQIAELQTSGPDLTDLRKFQAQTRRSRETELRQNGYWLGYLSAQYRNGDDPAEVLTDEARLNALTVETLKTAASRYFGPNRVQLVLLPGEK